jgi:hypothetical protein
MAIDFNDARLFKSSQYIVILPFIFGVVVLGKNLNGSKFKFVYLIVLLSLLSDFGSLVYDAVFVC